MRELRGGRPVPPAGEGGGGAAKWHGPRGEGVGASPLRPRCKRRWAAQPGDADLFTRESTRLRGAAWCADCMTLEALKKSCESDAASRVQPHAPGRVPGRARAKRHCWSRLRARDWEPTVTFDELPFTTWLHHGHDTTLFTPFLHSSSRKRRPRPRVSTMKSGASGPSMKPEPDLGLRPTGRSSPQASCRCRCLS